MHASKPRRSPLLREQVSAQSTEPPYTDPYVRWCGRGGAVRLPLSRSILHESEFQGFGIMANSYINCSRRAGPITTSRSLTIMSMHYRMRRETPFLPSGGGKGRASNNHIHGDDGHIRQQLS